MTAARGELNETNKQLDELQEGIDKIREQVDKLYDDRRARGSEYWKERYHHKQ